MNALHIDTFLNFWSVPEVAANILIILNMIGALLLGLLVGYERSYRGRAAGMRTYGLVCMSSCALISILGYHHLWYGTQQIYPTGPDPTRVIQGIVSGIGFLGAGVIMRDGLNISGLTTAASIWTVSAIGILVGVGFYASAISLALLSFIFMMWGARIEGFLPARHAIAVTVRLNPGAELSEHDLIDLVQTQGYELARGSFSIDQKDGRFEWRFVAISMGKDKGASLVNLGKYLSREKGFQEFTISHARN